MKYYNIEKYIEAKEKKARAFEQEWIMKNIKRLGVDKRVRGTLGLDHSDDDSEFESDEEVEYQRKMN